MVARALDSLYQLVEPTESPIDTARGPACWAQGPGAGALFLWFWTRCAPSLARLYVSHSPLSLLSVLHSLVCWAACPPKPPRCLDCTCDQTS